MCYYLCIVFLVCLCVVFWLCTCCNKYTKPDENTISGSHLLNTSFLSVETGKLISADIRFVRTHCHLNMDPIFCDINSMFLQILTALCVIVLLFLRSFCPSLLLECGAKLVPICCDENSMFTQISDISHDCSSFIFAVVLSILCHLNVGRL